MISKVQEINFTLSELCDKMVKFCVVDLNRLCTPRFEDRKSHRNMEGLLHKSSPLHPTSLTVQFVVEVIC